MKRSTAPASPTERPSLVRRWLSALALAALCSGLTAWTTASPSQAALPDRFGFVLFDGAGTVPSGTVPAATTVNASPVGLYKIVFPGAAAPGGVVHVIAISFAPRWCQAEDWAPVGADEVVLVSCHTVGGAAAPTSFSAFFESSSATVLPAALGRFGYVDALSTGTILSQFNSAGAVNSVVHTPGRYLVQLSGLDTADPFAGSLQVTAVNTVIAARCKVAQWLPSSKKGQQILVACFDGLGNPLDTRFTLTYQFNRSLYGAGSPPKHFGYLWNAPPVGPPPTSFGSPGVLATGLGSSLVSFPGLAIPPDNVQVTAFGTTSDFCGLNSFWTHSGADLFARSVSCFTNAGAPANAGFFISANSAS